MSKIAPKALLAAAIVFVAFFAGNVGSEQPASAVMDLSGDGGFFDLPFPTELRRKADGKIDVSDFPNPWHSEIVSRTKHDFEEGYGYTTAPAIYFRFSDVVGRTALPGLKKTMGRDGPLFLVNIDRDSPGHGEKLPVMARFFEESPRWISGADKVLAMIPVPGFVLRENTLYAAGVKRSLGDDKGAKLAKSRQLMAIAKNRAPQGKLGKKALDIYGPALEELEGQGIGTEEIASLTVFRTGDPTARMRQLFKGAVSGLPPGLAEDLTVTRHYDDFYVLKGAALMPLFQRGEDPFWHGRGGDIVFDASGKPIVQGHVRVPFRVTVPKTEMPEQGFPLLIYIHGTSGLSTQFIDRGVVTEDGEDPPPGTGPAMVLARRGIAAAGAAQLRNRERGGSKGKIFYHNVLNPKAYRDNILQSSIEQALFLRLLLKLQIENATCPETKASGKIFFNPQMVFGMGQSLGSGTLGPWAGVETNMKAVIHSGHGPYKVLQIAEGNQLNLKYLEKKGQGTGEGLLGMDRYHPLLNLLGAVLAPADSFAFEPHYYKRPLEGRSAKHLWVSFGTDDHYFPPSTQNASVVSMGLDLAGPAVISGTPEILKLARLERLDYPVSLNKSSPEGKVTAVTVQYKAAPPLDGHHINFQRTETRYQYGCFLKTLADTGRPVLYAPAGRWDVECGP